MHFLLYQHSYKQVIKRLYYSLEYLCCIVNVDEQVLCLTQCQFLQVYVAFSDVAEGVVSVSDFQLQVAPIVYCIIIIIIIITVFLGGEVKYKFETFL